MHSTFIRTYSPSITSCLWMSLFINHISTFCSVLDIEIGEEFKQEPIFDEYPQIFVTPCPSPVDNYFINDHNYAKFTILNQINKTDRFLNVHFKNSCDKSISNRPCKCDKYCKDYKQKGNLTTHVKFAHGNAPIFSCGYCSYSTKQKSSLINHVKAKHEELSSIPRKRYTCNVCKKIYKGKEGLNKHWKIIHGTAPSYFCNYCSFSTKHKSQHIMHIKAIHDARKNSQVQNIEKPHKCETCNRTYTRRTGLWQHKRFACGKEPSFFCALCEFSGKQKSQLVCHIRNRHDASDAKPKFECTKCHRLYKYKAGLVRHVNFQCKQWKFIELKCIIFRILWRFTKLFYRILGNHHKLS